MRFIYYHLCVRRCVYRSDQATVDTNILMKYFDDWCKAIGCARCGSDDIKLLAIIEMLVASHNNIEDALIIDWGCDNNFSYTMR